MDCFAWCHCCQTQTKTLPSQTSNDQKSRDRLLSQILFLPARFAILYRQRNLLTQRSTRRDKEDRKAAIIFHNNRWRLRCAMNTTCTNSATRRLKNIPSLSPKFKAAANPSQIHTEPPSLPNAALQLARKPPGKNPHAHHKSSTHPRFSPQHATTVNPFPRNNIVNAYSSPSLRRKKSPNPKMLPPKQLTEN